MANPETSPSPESSPPTSSTPPPASEQIDYHKPGAAHDGLCHMLEMLLIAAKEQFAATGQSVTLGWLVGALGDRSHAVVILVMSAPFLFVPLPGLSTPIGLLLLFFGLAVTIGGKAWLPGFVSKKTVSVELLEKIVGAVNKVLVRVEKIAKPRMLWVTAGVGHVLMGLSLMAAIVALALPIPIPYNNAPPAFVIVILAFGLLERDGVLAIIGHLLTLVMWAVMILLGSWLLSESYEIIMKLWGYVGGAAATQPSTLPAAILFGNL